MVSINFFIFYPTSDISKFME